MIVADLGAGALRRRLRSGITLDMGPFRVRIASPLPHLAAQLRPLYADYPVADDTGIADLHVRLERGSGLRRWLRPQVRFLIDGRPPFEPFPEALALPLLEWGINWVLAMRANQYLLLHAAVVERGGRALVMPAWPGHGKTTLCAALVHRGWRFFSDEFGCLRPEDGQLLPIPRVLPLKNESIEVIRDFAPEAVMGPSFPNTRKGTVAHLRPPTDSIRRAGDTACPGWIVFPRWSRGAPLSLRPMAKPRAFMQVASNAFNYEVLGAAGFRAVGRTVRACPCYALVYSDLDEAVAALERLATETA